MHGRVSVSGFYASRKREPSHHSREDAELAEQIKDAFRDNRSIYGSPRIHAELQAQGWHCARKRVARSVSRAGTGGKTSTPSHGHYAQRGRSKSSSQPAPTGL